MIGLKGELIEYHTHFRWALIVVGITFFILTGRFFHLQILQGDRFESLATVSHIVKLRIPPTRGIIRDRNGEVLATDVEVADLMVVPRYVKEPDSEIARIVELGILSPERGETLLEKIRKAKPGRRGFHRMVARSNLVGDRCPFDMSRMTFDPKRGKLVCTQCGRAWPDQRAVVQSHLHELPGFSLRSRAVRHFPAREYTAHTVGLVNEVTAKEVAESEGRLRSGETIGRTGVERALDRHLRGIPGEEVFVRSASGRRVPPKDLPHPFGELESSSPSQGHDVNLTIDMNLQKAAHDALAPHNSGAVVLMEVDTGQVLAMYSQPSFDPEPSVIRPAGEVRVKADPILSPMMNKAVTAYPPGSVFKMVTAIAALAEGLIDADTKVECPGYYLFKRRKFRCHLRSGHEEVSLVPALAASCDVFFYMVAEKLGMDTLALYGRDYFGIGERTGVEIPESRGLMPTEKWYKDRKRGWQPGFVLNTSVGQGDMRATPLAIARAYAALVNGGRLLEPQVVLSLQDPDGGVEMPKAPRVLRTLELDGEMVRRVMTGLHAAVNTEDGTAYEVRIDELPFAGKTGTAQAPEVRKDASPEVAVWLKQDHAWFVAYAPSRNPQVVVVAFVEHGGFGGKVAAPVARKVLEAYYAEHADEFADQWEGFDRGPILEIVDDRGLD